MPFVPAVLLAACLIALASFLVLKVLQRTQKSKPKNFRRTTSSNNSQKEYKGRATLLFGTQTGTAERFTKQLKGELIQRYGDDTAYDVIDVEEYDHEAKLANEKLVLLLLATYGDGEPTDNAAAFYNWLTRAASEVEKGTGDMFLQGVHFGVFGLGNKQYEHFCAVGKRVHSAMTALGAQPLVDRGDGDDDEDIEADFDEWREKLFTALDDSAIIQYGGLPKRISTILELVPANSVPTFEVNILGEKPVDLAKGPQATGDGTSIRSPFSATVTTTRELHNPGSERSCLHLELDFTGSEATYEAGDHVGILVQNEPEVVDRAAVALGLSPDLVFELDVPEDDPDPLQLPFSGPISLRHALAWHTDLLSPINKVSLQALAAFAKGEDFEKLKHLLSAEGREDYKAWQRQSRSLLEVLEEFKGVNPPLGVFFGAIAGRLQARYYSISSSPKVSPKSVHVTCSLVRHSTVTGRLHRGVASHFLKRCQVGDKLPAFIRRSTFKLPADHSAPLLMIGPGTGLAPFRGFLQERAALAASGVKLGTAHLFFGCRNRKHDFIYEAELEDLKQQGGYTRLHTAFSREGPHKVYVQHHIERHSRELWPLISEGGYVYVCGEAKNMAKDVHKTLQKLAGKAPQGGENFMAELSQSGRYQKDVW